MSLRLVVRTAWKLRWQIVLSVPYFLLNRFVVVMLTTVYCHVHMPWTLAVLFPGFISIIMLRESLSLPPEEEPEGQRGCSSPKLHAARDLGGTCSSVCVLGDIKPLLPSKQRLLRLTEQAHSGQAQDG